MAVSQSQIVDLLYKQAFGVTKTDTATNKSPSNESIPSPALNRGDTLWTEADQIPGTAAATAGIVQAYTGANAVQCTADNTTVPIGGIYPTWKTNLTYWIPSEFGSTYNVQVFIDNSGAADPTSTGTQIFADGSGGTGQYYYDYQSGVLNFIGETIPAGLTSGKVLYVVGYRYIGKVGVNDLPDDTTIGNLSVNDTTIASINTNANIELSPNGTGVVNSTANVVAPYFIGNVEGNISGNVVAPGSNTEILFNDGGVIGANTLFTFDKATGELILTGNAQFNNANLGNLGTANYIDVTNLANIGNVTITYELSGNYANFTNNVVTNNTTINLELAGNTANFSGNVILPNLQVNLELVGNTANFSGNVVVPNLTVNLELAGNTANFSGNIKTLNANLGNLAEANYVNVSSTLNVTDTANVGNAVVNNLTQYQLVFPDNTNKLVGSSDLYWDVASSALWTTGIYSNGLISTTSNVDANNANITANLTSGNANLGNLATANYINVANDLNVTGNITGANLIGSLANGNSNVKVYGNANVEVTVSGNSNVATFASTGLYVVGEINTTAGNMLSNGNISANGFLNGANANITGQAELGIVLTANITAPVDSLTLSAAGSDQNIYLVPTGLGTVDLGLHRITQLGDPTQPHDAATKEYVDAMAGEGLDIHTPVRVETPDTAGSLNATYAQGGTTQTTTDISGGKTITFSANHGLSVNDGIVWDNSFNGIVGGEAYWVETVPALNQITVRDGYYGAEVTTLTNGTGLTQASRANPGVGATLTNAGANAALTIDGIALANTNRVLIYNQTNSAENGIYVVTDVGNSTAAWVLTRSSDFDKYIPDSSAGMSKGSYVFVTAGATGAGESYVMTSPIGEVIIGTDALTFTQFSAAGSYTAGNGIAITGTTISANTDGVTTDVVGGNIVVKSSANLTTPNVGDATFSSLSWNNLSNGNVTANNLSTSNIANIGLDLTVGGIAQVNGNINSNANVNSNNIFVTNFVDIGANLLANNITSNHVIITTDANVSNLATINQVTINTELSGNYANFTNNVVANNVTVNSEFSGNTANFSGNVILPNLQVNSAIAGNTANFSGNVILPNLQVNSAIAGNTANFSGNVVVPNLTVNLELAGNTANFSGNVTVNNMSVTNELTANVINLTGEITVPNLTVNNSLTGNYANFSNNVVTNNATVNLEFSGNTANFSGNVILPNLQVNSEIAGNTANFSGNVIVPNLTVNLELAGNTANFTGNIKTLNANLGNLATANLIEVSSNVVTSNLTVNLELSGNTANFSSNVVVNNLTTNLELAGNTANFSGNVVVPNLTVNLELAGNTANFSGNIKSLNANLGNLATANYINVASDIVTSNLTVNLELSGNTANFTGNIAPLGILTDNYYYANGSPVDFQQAAGSNNEIQFNSDDDFSASANLTFDPSTNVLGVIGDANISNAIVLGNTTTTWATVTTTAITANQTIASLSVTGVTGVEYLVKAVDSTGSKYSVATVQAVTDGTSVDYSTYGTVYLGGSTGVLAVNIVGGLIRLQVTPSSSNSTVWTTQYRII